MTTALQSLLEDSLELASLPEVVMRAVELINDPGTSAVDIGRVVSDDPALSTRLLRIVNSPFYGFPSHIDTISRAVTVIGTLELLDLILATSVVKAFAGVPDDLVNMDDFWAHSVYTGIVARLLAARHRAPHTERFFVAGLLHEVGSLVIYRQRPTDSRAILQQARAENRLVHEVERAVLGFDHAEVGAALMARWHLPEVLQVSTRMHHRPSEAGDHRLEAAIVHLADVIASSAMMSDNGQVPPLDEAAWQLTGLPVDIVESLVQEADRQFTDARDLLLPNSYAA